MEWVKSLCTHPFDSDGTSVLLVAGDVSDSLARLEQTFTLLKRAFAHVFFVPGNHELWLPSSVVPSVPSMPDSIARLDAILRLCDALGVQTRPAYFSVGLWVVPLTSWHHQSWDTEADVPGAPAASRLTIPDYARCVWPAQAPGGRQPGSSELAEWVSQTYCDRRQLQAIADSPAHVISMSHFLPYAELLPEKRYLFYPNLAKVVGSQFLAEHVSILQPALHVFGHTHFAWDAVAQGVRCVQAPLCYPLERTSRAPSIAMEPAAHWMPPRPERHGAQLPWLPLPVARWVRQAGHAGGNAGPWACEFAPRVAASWSTHYATRPRTPENTEPYFKRVRRRRA